MVKKPRLFFIRLQTFDRKLIDKEGENGPPCGSFRSFPLENPKSLRRRIQVRINFGFYNGYQLTRYRKVNNEKNCVGLSEFVVVVC